MSKLMGCLPPDTASNDEGEEEVKEVKYCRYDTSRDSKLHIVVCASPRKVASSGNHDEDLLDTVFETMWK